MKTTYKYLSLLFVMTAFLGFSQEKNRGDEFSYEKIDIIDQKESIIQLKGAENTISNSEKNEFIVAANEGQGVTPGFLSVTPAGAAQYSVPIAVPPGIKNVTPEIALTYNSHNGNGVVGYGWSISGVSAISRIPSTKFHDGETKDIKISRSDRFALDGKRLILKRGAYYGAHGAVYETEQFSNLKITSYGFAIGVNDAPSRFVVNYPDGSVAEYGSSAGDERTPMNYSIASWTNPQGLRISYEYIKEDNNLYVSKISYGHKDQGTPINNIQFIYKDIQNTLDQAYVGGFSFKKKKHLISIKVYSNNEIYRGYSIIGRSTNIGYRRVTRITEYTKDSKVYRKPIIFKYDDTPKTVAIKEQTTALSVVNINQVTSETIPLDWTGNGKLDFIVYPKNSKDKLWLFEDIESNTTNRAYTINTGVFETVFASRLLTHNNKIAFGEGITVIQNTEKFKVNFKTFSRSTNIGPMENQYNKVWDAPTFYVNIGGISVKSRAPQKYISGDFNGDGVSDVMAFNKSNSGTCIPYSGNCAFWTSVHFIDLKRDVTTNFTNPAGELQKLIGLKDRLFSGDFNGNGKTDILHVNASTNKLFVYELDNNNRLKLLWSFGYSGIANEMPLLLGDYNGDGKTDILIPNEDKSNVFSRLMSTGRGFDISALYTTFKYRKSYTPGGGIVYAYNLIPFDANGDGKTDLIYHSSITTNNSNEGIQTLDVFHNMGIRDRNSIIFRNIGSTYTAGRTAHFPIPIFLSSEKPNKNLQFATISNKWITSYTLNSNHKEDVLMRSVTNNGVERTIDYTTMGTSRVYEFGNKERYPYGDIKTAFGTKLVSKLKRISSGSPTLYQEFAYHQGVYNVEGLGFIGFKGFAESNWYTNASDRIFNVSKYDTNKRGALTSQYTMRDDYSFTVPSSNYITKTVYKNSYWLSANKVFKITKGSYLTQDAVTGTYTNASYQYDQYNNPKKITTNYSGQGSHILDITYDNSVTGNYYIGRPIAQVETKIIGGDTFKTKKELEYSDYLLRKKTTTGNGAPPDIEEYDYDSFGNVIKKTVKPHNTPARVIQFKYDASGRFLEKHTDVEGQVTSYQYDINNGTLRSETNPQGLKTRYDYDLWYRSTKVTDYLSKANRTEYAESKPYEYTLTNTGVDGSESKTIYDRLGRVKTEQEKDVLGQWVKVDYQYDKFDRIWKESEPYTGNAPTQWKITNYDFYGRPTKQILHTGRVISMSYNGLSVTVNDGVKTVQRTNDAMGNIKEVTDPGGKINYTYFGNGNIKSANYGGTVVTREQDGWGRKTKLIDPAAGTYEYEYNGFGELTKEKTPKGETNYTYSPIGKLKEKTITGNDTDLKMFYAYKATNKLLETISMTDASGNNSSYKYSYDKLHRLSQTVETNPYAKFTKKLTYDGFGRVNTEESLGQLLSNGKSTSKKVKNIYQYGALKTISNFSDGEVLWNISGLNARGQATVVTMGNNLREESKYNPYGYLEENKVINNGGFIPEELMKLEFNFNSLRGTLSSRKNSLFSWSETFQYDDLDRLINFEDNDSNNGHIYDNSGRIVTNTIVGDYNYDGRSYQVDDITLNIQGDLYYQQNNLQQVSYNAVKKPLEVYETGKDKVSFQYNGYMGRAHMFYGDSQDDKLQRNNRKHYSFDGTMEISYDANLDKTTFVNYIGGDAYNAPAIWRSEQASDTKEGNYYLYRDYLGSIIMITDRDGNIEEKRHFDAWGNLVKVADSNNRSLSKLTFLDRGYTGHEHLQGVNLIHMNGRLYDPKLRRFLAPDNHIQDPFNSQSFNRYGYAWNNPLMYTDLNGEVFEPVTFVILTIVFSAIGATVLSDMYNAIFQEEDSDSSGSTPNQVATPNSNNNTLESTKEYITHPFANKQLDQPSGISQGFAIPTIEYKMPDIPIHEGAQIINSSVSNGNQIQGDGGFSINTEDVINTTLDFIPLAGGVNDIRIGFNDGNYWLVALGSVTIVADVFTLGSASLVKGAIKTGIKAGTKYAAKGAAKSIARKGDEVIDVYRVYGGKAKPNGFSWTPINPNNVSNYRNAAGLPNVNTGRFVIKGTTNTSSIIKSRSALPLDGNKGGLIEYIIDPKNVDIRGVYGINPQF